MKRCPECRRDYFDDSLLYCLDDGSPLLEGPGGDDLSASASTEASHFSESPTRLQSHTTGQTAFLPTQKIQSEAVAGVGYRRIAVLLGSFLLILAGGYFGYRFLTQSKPIASIAVMPFVNASGNADLEYLSDGMTETLINSLSQLPTVSVKARSLVFRYKGKDLDPKQIASELGAEVVLNGRVLQRGNSLTLSLELVDAATGNQLWGEQYVRDVSDLVVLQKEIARDVSNKLTARITGADETKLSKSSTVDPAAYQLYLQGRYQWNRRTNEGVAKSREYFQQAIAKDPNYALAYVGLADSYVVIDDLPAHDRNPKAKAAARKALELDPSLGEAHAVLANTAFYFDWDWPTAEREYSRAIELNPNYATGHHWYAETLSALGRRDESFAEFKTAMELDPVSAAISSDLGWAHFNARQYDRAVEHLKKLIDAEPEFVRSYFYLATVYEEMGRFEEAIELRRAGLVKDGRDTNRIEEVATRFRKAFAAGGAAGYWKVMLELAMESAKRHDTQPDSVEVASVYAKLKDRDNAIEWLEKAYEYRSTSMATLNVDPTWDNLRDDPRFADLIRRVGIPTN